MDNQDTQHYDASPIASGLTRTGSVIDLDECSDAEEPSDDLLRRSLATEFSTALGAGSLASHMIILNIPKTCWSHGT